MNEKVNAAVAAPVQTKLEIPPQDKVSITYFTDPLCCYSWAMEPQWRRLQYEYQERITVQYVMGGLLPDWTAFEDSVNNISRPAQMGPLWMQASNISGMPMESKIWHIDPPVSSYPACIGVKCAQLQSHAAGARYLRLLRESLMLHGNNISRQEVLVAVAEQLAIEMPQFDVQRFERDLVNGNGLDAFRNDMHIVQIQNIQRFPALLFRRLGYPAVLITGYKPYAVLLQAFSQVAGDMPKTNNAIGESYLNYWTSLTEREIAEIQSEPKL
jgi:putative protein-disulfide isomerase